MLHLLHRTRHALILLVAGQLLCADPPPKELMGRWRSFGTSSSGLGAMLTFHSNGVVDCIAGAVVDGTYRIEGDEMIVPPSSIKGPEVRQKMVFLGLDRLRMREVEWIRTGTAPDANHPILGEWTTRWEMSGRQGEARYLFYSAGKSLFLWPFVPLSPGRYSIKGSIMHLEVPDQPEAEGTFQIEGDVLTVPGPNGSSYRLQRY